MDYQTFEEAFSLIYLSNGTLGYPITGPIWQGCEDLLPLTPTRTLVLCPFVETKYQGYQEPAQPVAPPPSDAVPAPTPTLLGLPKKLREIIYTYALTYPQPLQVHKRTHIRSWRANNGSYHVERCLRTSWTFTPPLLLTCTQIQAEALPIFFGANSFQANIPDGDLHDLLEWLTDTPTHLTCLVKKLVLNVEPTCVTQLIELNDRAHDEDDLWRQAVALADAVARAGISCEKIQVKVRESEHLKNDKVERKPKKRDSVLLMKPPKPELAVGVADRWVQGLAEVLAKVEKLGMDGDADD